MVVIKIGVFETVNIFPLITFVAWILTVGNDGVAAAKAHVELWSLRA